MYQIDKEQEKTTQQVLDVLEKWGSESRFIWFRELHRVTDIDKGILRNIINELKKSKEIKDLHGTNNRIFFFFSALLRLLYQSNLHVIFFAFLTSKLSATTYISLLYKIFYFLRY